MAEHRKSLEAPITKLILIILFLIIGNSVQAEEVLIFGNEYKPPKIWAAESGPSGILVDILKYAGREMEVDFKVKLFPWLRAYHHALHAKGGIVGISKTDERLGIFDYSIPLYYDEVILVVKKGEEFKFESFEDLRGKTIGMTRGASYGPQFEAARKYFRTNEDSSNLSRLKMLLKERIHAAAISPGVGAFKRILADNPEANLKPGDFTILEKRLTRDPNHLAFSKKMGRSDFLKAFNAALEKGFETGEIQKIIDRYPYH